MGEKPAIDGGADEAGGASDEDLQGYARLIEERKARRYAATRAKSKRPRVAMRIVFAPL
jgi:hypothetical protein